MSNEELKKWLRENSSGNYRPAAEAAALIEQLEEGLESFGRAVMALEARRAEERIAADKKEKELCDLLMRIREDYNHPWPNEDSGTHDHRTTIFNKITAVLAE